MSIQLYAFDTPNGRKITVALEEMGHEPAEGGLIVRLPKVETDPEFEVGVTPPVSELLPFFLSALSLWRWWHAQEVAYLARREAAKADHRLVAVA